MPHWLEIALLVAGGAILGGVAGAVLILRYIGKSIGRSF